MPNSPGDVAAGAPNPEVYTDNRNGTVTDDVTGLMWQQTVSEATYSWNEAVALCPTLTLAGHNNWRLPSRVELVSIVDDSRTDGVTGSTAFPRTPSGYFWSSSRVTDGPTDAWSVVFIGGTYSVVASDLNYVRCVAFPGGATSAAGATAPARRYAVSSGTVTDTKTNLIWQQTVPPKKYTWAEAKTTCASVGASLGGEGWRLPTMKELQTLIDESRTNPAIDPTAFPDTPAAPFWSSSPVIDSPGYAWNVYFYNGSTYSVDVAYTFNARCVR